MGSSSSWRDAGRGATAPPCAACRGAPSTAAARRLGWLARRRRRWRRHRRRAAGVAVRRRRRREGERARRARGLRRVARARPARGDELREHALRAVADLGPDGLAVGVVVAELVERPGCVLEGPRHAYTELLVLGVVARVALLLGHGLEEVVDRVFGGRGAAAAHLLQL